jgi:ribosomal protein S12 methylthiotransferase accessory factor
MGVACRSTYEKAIEKAYLEWVQGCVFAGFYDIHHPSLDLDRKNSIKGFDEHAVYYTLHPEKWSEVPLIKNRQPYHKNTKVIISEEKSDTKTLEELLQALAEEDIRILYRDLTLADVRETGLSVIRAISPDLSLIHADEKCPFLGGRTSDIAWRYKNLDKQSSYFPNPFPHPLG